MTEALARLEESKKRANVVCSERVEFARREKKAVVARIDAEKAMIRGKMKRLRES